MKGLMHSCAFLVLSSFFLSRAMEHEDFQEKIDLILAGKQSITPLIWLDKIDLLQEITNQAQSRGISLEAIVNKSDKQNRLPLQVALLHHRYKWAHWLLKYGALVNISPLPPDLVEDHYKLFARPTPKLLLLLLAYGMDPQSDCVQEIIRHNGELTDVRDNFVMAQELCKLQRLPHLFFNRLPLDLIKPLQNFVIGEMVPQAKRVTVSRPDSCAI